MKRALGVLLLLSAISMAYGQTKSYWLYGLGTEEYHWSELQLGSTIKLSLSYGWVEDSYFLLPSVDLFTGPISAFEKSYLTYQGTGGALTFGGSFGKRPLTSPGGTLGFLLGMSYRDIVGKSFYSSKNNRHDGIEDGAFESYKMHIQYLDLSFGFFYALLNAQNAKNKEMTQFEGVLASTGFAFPFYSHYKQSFTLVSQGAEEPRTIADQGVGSGFTIFFQLIFVLSA